MTRWARANNVHKHKPEDAATWSQLRAGVSGETTNIRTGSNGGSSSGSRSRNSASDGLLQNKGSSGRRRETKRKQLDVNGFMDYLEQTGQPLPRGLQGANLVEPNTGEVSLKKFKRRENRRMKRQKTKMNNMVCFNCRKPGHGLADCPTGGADDEMGTGICYRCGSTEHEIQRCRAKVDPAVGDYPYAKCFICGKTGHLSRSCPENPKGLYATGGCCRICGSVEHFQKDCPEHQTSTNSITLSRLSNRISADHEDVHVPVKDVSPKKAKVVVF